MYFLSSFLYVCFYLVAVKIIELGDKKEERIKVEKEVNMMKACSHQNIVQYKNSFLHGSSLWVRILLLFFIFFCLTLNSYPKIHQ